MTVNLKKASTDIHGVWESIRDRAPQQPVEDKLLALRERIHAILVDLDAIFAEHGGK
jgi:hypothetical protein